MNMQTAMLREMFAQKYGDSTLEITKLIMAANKAETKAGKKSLFGKDLGKEAQQQFVDCLFDTAEKLRARGQISWSTNTPSMFRAMDKVMLQAKLAFPNWPDAYRLWSAFYSTSMQAMGEAP